MRTRRITAIAAGAALLSLTACTTAPSEGEAAPTSLDSVQIIVPADPGGGWDQTGRALSQVLTESVGLSSAAVTNIGGAGGTVGLAALANETDPATLMVMGLVMVGAVETNAAESRIEDTTPIARLTEEALVVVVPAASEYETLEDLVNDIAERGQAVSVTGGSAGGADHILAGLMLGAAGIPADEIPTLLNYIPNSGGGEAVSLVLGNNVSAGISGIGEFAEHIEAGTMRALAVSSAEQVAILPGTPTISESGYDVVLTNWRGLVAPGSITDEERAALEDIVEQAHATSEWQAELETRGWSDAFLIGPEFDEFLTADISNVVDTLRSIGLVS